MPDRRNLVFRIIFTYFGLPNGLDAFRVCTQRMLHIQQFVGEFFWTPTKKIFYNRNLYYKL